MRRVLVTGAHGFIGKNFVKMLVADASIHVLPIIRTSTAEELAEAVLGSDAIVHLAGEVRPDSHQDTFWSSNAGLTETIIAILEHNKRKTPILFASTIHAGTPNNAYGESKRAAEEIIKTYTKKNMVTAAIFRLPHVFGEGCKPNYNSVISTWLYNTVHNNEIKVFDRSIEMRYVYVQDVIDALYAWVKHGWGDISASTYREMRPVYHVTLGEVVDLLEKFKKGEPLLKSDFQRKLHRTYLNYLTQKDVEA